MEFFRNPSFDFLGKKWYFAALSIAAVVGSFALLATKGLTYGIDFRGGADVVLRFREEPAIDQIRSALSSAGMDGAQIQAQRLPEAPTAHDILIRVPPRRGATGEIQEEQGDISGRVLAALGRSGVREIYPDKVDVYFNGVRAVRSGVVDRTSSPLALRNALRPKIVRIRIDLHGGRALGRYVTCDLSAEYVRINAEYRT